MEKKKSKTPAKKTKPAKKPAAKKPAKKPAKKASPAKAVSATPKKPAEQVRLAEIKPAKSILERIQSWFRG